MAMTKKELAEMDRLRADLALSRAMRWPDYPKPAPMSYEQIKANLVEGGIKYGGQPEMVARGWFYNAYLGGHSVPDATYGCSTGNFHNMEGNTTSSQNGGKMFATRANALRALRLDLTEKVATLLAAVDRKIAEADD